MVIELENLTKAFRRTVAVDHISCTIQENSFTTLLGPSGCGKTTTLRLIAGLEIPDAGKISRNGEILSSEHYCLPPERRGMGMVFQTFAVWPHMSVYANIEYGLKMRKIPVVEHKERIKGIVSLLRLEGLEQRYPSQLSGGQLQRTGLARALVVDPKVLLLDEPLSNLDAKMRVEMRSELTELQRKLGTTFIYVTHDQVEAMTMSDAIILLYKGKITQTGSPTDIYENPKAFMACDFIGSPTVLRGRCVRELSATDVLIDVNGYEIVCRTPDHITEQSKALVCIRPEALVLQKNRPADATNIVECKVEAFSSLGGTTEVQLMAGEMKLLLRTTNRVDVRKGEDVFVALDPHHCFAFAQT